MLLWILVYIGNCEGAIYAVKPDEPPNVSCHRCKYMYQYQHDMRIYFTSNTQLHYQPGRYYIRESFIIKNVHNISFIGSSSINTVIHCKSTENKHVSIEMRGITNLTLRNLLILNCQAKNTHQNILSYFKYYVSLVLLNCYNVLMEEITLKDNGLEFGGRLLLVNVLGNSILVGITCCDVSAVYEGSDNSKYHNHTLTIYKYNAIFYEYIGGALDVFQEIPDINYNNQFFDDYMTDSKYGLHQDEYYDYRYTNSFRSNLPYGFHYVDDDRYYDPNHVSNTPIPMYTGVDDIRFYYNNVDDVNTIPALSLILFQNTYGVSIEIIDATFYTLEYYEALTILSDNCGNHRNKIYFKNCTFSNNEYRQSHRVMSSLVRIQLTTCMTKHDKIQLVGNNIIEFNNCSFIQNVYEGSLISALWKYKNCSHNETTKSQVKEQIIIANCSFKQNKFSHILEFASTKSVSVITILRSTQFEDLYEGKAHFITGKPAIFAINVSMLMEGPISFNAIDITKSLIHTNTKITVVNSLTFSNVNAECLFSGQKHFHINLISNVHINITNISIRTSAFAVDHNNDNNLYSSCFFQYYQSQNKNGTPVHNVAIADNNNNKILDFHTGNVNCKLAQGSLYHGMNPLTVHQRHFQITNKTGTYPLFNTGLLCYCLDKLHSNCFTNTLGPIYPGQSIGLYLTLNPSVTSDDALPISVKIYVEDITVSVCKVSSLLQAEQFIRKSCTQVNLTILAENEEMCQLILYSTKWYYPTIYFVKLRKCPLGFLFNKLIKSCICDPMLVVNNIIGYRECDINDQTILRLANSWISAITHNNSYTYHISLHCTFRYCLPYSSHLNFSTPNSQCQFNRSGLLCGHCQQGLSTVFSSSHCKTCSNIYLLLIIPIIVVGFVLVILLFLLNLTVTDGAVNGFILYANIISINTPILFPNVSHFTPAYTFISLANLDLGIQTCFYNGMDDYAKMWLQLAFPFYLIFIATLIIITSRYSTTIQRLTARRALPVLATLFLLSYTKILRIVSSVLFFYSTITHLPSKHTTLVWSVDTNAPLFGVRFTILFIVCLILFLILVPFNVILLFTRTLSRFRFINKFKPLLDAYQGPYKIKFYYWTGLQLLIRVIFFGTSSLDRNLSLTVGIALFSLIGGIQGVLKPFKMESKNFQEQLFLVNITILYAFLLYNQEAINTMVVNIIITMAAIHFTLIITYHIITYVCSAVIKHKIKSSFTTIFKWINTLQGKPQNDNRFELQDNVRCNIPEAVNYHEFRDPLLNQV